MGVLSFIFIIVMVAMVSDTAVKVIKARNAGGGRQVDDLRRLLDEQSDQLSHQQDQIAELQERTDFMERLLARTREQGLIDERLPDQPPGQ
jgi:hypothetical protein